MREQNVWMLRVKTAISMILVNCKAVLSFEGLYFEELYYAHPTSKASVFSSMFLIHIYGEVSLFSADIHVFASTYLHTYTLHKHLAVLPQNQNANWIPILNTDEFKLSPVCFWFVFPSCREFSHWKVNSLATEKRDFFKAPLPLSPEFLRNLRLLGRRPTLQQIHENLIKKYGTHFLVSATLGGMLSPWEIAIV